MHIPSIPTVGYKALRKGRYSERNRIYHVTARTHAKANIFLDFGDARILAEALHIQHQTGLLESLAFVVMPDHLHWLVQLTGDRSLSSCVNVVKSRTSRKIHAHGRFRGQVWQRGFHDRALRREEDLPAVARYIVANPLRAGLVRSVGDYPHWDAKWV